jgi:hypothetical protein
MDYTIIKREALAMVYTLHKFRHYLLDMDHMALLYLIKKTSIVRTKCEVVIIIPRIRFFSGVQTKELPFCGGHFHATS